MRPGPSSGAAAARWPPSAAAALAPGAALYTLLRLPSFFEPHWYTDEAGYLSAGRALLQGAVVYSDAWNNKPPLHLWTMAAAFHMFGTNQAALHVLSFLAGLVAMAAIAYTGVRLLSPRRTTIAVLLGAFVLGNPLLGAELTVPESLLIAPTSWAGAIVLTRLRGDGRVWPVASGLLAAAAIAYQQTAIADAAALAAIIAFGARRWRPALALFLLTTLGATAAWLIPTLAVAGPSRVAFALVGFYVPFTASVLPSGRAWVLLHFLLLLASTGLVLAGCALLRTRDVRLWGTWMWAGATTLVAAAAQQPYAHYLLPAIVPLALAVASLPRPRPTLPAGAGARSLAAGILIAVGLASVVRGDWVFHEGWLFQYYGGAVGVATQRWSLASWQRASFDSRVAGDEQVCDYIRSHGLTGARTVVWSSDAWPYLLCDLPLLLPTAPIYNNQVLFGEHGPVARKVEALDPELIVTSADDVEQFPEIKPLLDQRYRRVVDASPNELWVRTD